MKKVHLLFAAVSLLIVTGCSDVLIDDISSESVNLRAPANNSISNTSVQNFWWDELSEDIVTYRLEIVSPSFDSIVELVLRVDVTEENPYEVTLEPGEYEWTVVASNSRNETIPEIHKLEIVSDSIMDLTSQNIALLGPVNESFSNDSEVDFLWQLINGAQDYRLQVASPNFSNSTFFVLDESTSGDFFTTTLTEGTYLWRVRGENDNSVTPYTEQEFTLDFTEPVAPTLLSPLEGDTITLPFTLSWEVDATSYFDSIFIYADSLMSAPIIATEVSGTTFSFSNNTFPFYFWRLRSIDQAGNVGDFSPLQKFYID